MKTYLPKIFRMDTDGIQIIKEQTLLCAYGFKDIKRFKSV